MATIEVLEDADLSGSQHGKFHIERDMETLTVDSGITENSDRASSVSAPDSPNQPCLSSTSGSMEGELDTANIQPPQCKEAQPSKSEGDVNSSSTLNECRKTTPSLLECLEPRPPPSSNREDEEEGGVSPKDVHRHLMRRVENMNSNGHSISDSSDSSVRVPHEHSPPLAIPPSQQKPWTVKLPFLKR